MNILHLRSQFWFVLVIAALVPNELGCHSSRQFVAWLQPANKQQSPVIASANSQQQPAPIETQPSPVSLASHHQVEVVPAPVPARDYCGPESLTHGTVLYEDTLASLESWAINSNPTLRRLREEAEAARERTGYVATLPDPSFGTTFFIPPMALIPDRQVAEVQVMQMIPWLSRLGAEAQQAHLDALAAENMYRAERLRVVGDLRANWFKLYVLGKQIETIEADKVQLESLIKTANARIANGDAQPGDVLMATLELSALQEQLLSYRQQVAATTAELNRLAGRDVSVPIMPPSAIEAVLPHWDHEMLRQIARQSQPELNAARLRTAAAEWGIEVARLKRRPDLTFGAGWILMDAPGSMMSGAGTDSFTVGLTATVPLWQRKYDAMTAEATSVYTAAQASEDEVALQLDALLRDLWEQARASQQTVELYEKSILPQARQTFEADQKSLVNNTVTFDRVVRDYRTLLNLELGYHRALGQLATTLARISQTVGVDLPHQPMEGP